MPKRARTRRGYPVELLENMQLVLRRDANPGIAHIDADIAWMLPNPDEHTPLRRVAQGIAHQVIQDASEHDAIGVHRSGRRAHDQPEAPRSRNRMEVALHFVEQRRQRKIPAFGLKRARVDLRQIQQPVEQALQ